MAVTKTCKWCGKTFEPTFGALSYLSEDFCTKKCKYEYENSKGGLPSHGEIKKNEKELEIKEKELELQKEQMEHERKMAALAVRNGKMNEISSLTFTDNPTDIYDKLNIIALAANRSIEIEGNDKFGTFANVCIGKYDKEFYKLCIDKYDMGLKRLKIIQDTEPKAKMIYSEALEDKQKIENVLISFKKKQKKYLYIILIAVAVFTIAAVVAHFTKNKEQDNPNPIELFEKFKK